MLHLKGPDRSKKAPFHTISFNFSAIKDKLPIFEAKILPHSWSMHVFYAHVEPELHSMHVAVFASGMQSI